MTLGVILGIAAILIAPAVGYLTIVRRLSGKIGTSDASKLWEAAEQMRKEYRAEIERLQAVVDRMEARLDELQAKNGDLHRMIEAHEQTIEDLRKQVASLEKRNEALETENVELKRRIGEVETNGS